ncbi:interferon-inducible double-stranded RNA-dependent protein kinase activator A homolog A-like [Ctenocephalides felis]|uniref:interferon-inducible double-stranded RNA-dependent protein kinase activator A homolog A-like n=1 Tax=Ctenocephalides felis TaxID=7515 RepID=UPI000E6E2C8C|nr:interferon-inducible double-stranded RNA-dependent protein kinase activator A homolog A-like [Ctenocephalides felis]
MAQETPVSTLMNLCAAKKVPCPKFTLVHDGTATINPIFKYEVCLVLNETEIRAIGTGSSKKMAKHDCSRLALKKISEMNPIQPHVLEVIETDAGKPSTRVHESVQELIDFCRKRGLPIPEYTLIGDIGPAHAKQFTMQCAVSTFKETATAFSKKSAKHLSAKK